MSLDIQQRCTQGVVVLLVLAFASVAQARDIFEVPSALYFTQDETVGIQLPTPDEDYTFPFFEAFTGFNLRPDDFTADSTRQFRQLAQDLIKEVNKPRLRPFLAAWVYDTAEDTFVVADRALGPMLAERPTTIGKGRFAMGWSYQQVNWDRLNGRKLKRLSVRVNHADVDHEVLGRGMGPDGQLRGRLQY